MGELKAGSPRKNRAERKVSSLRRNDPPVRPCQTGRSMLRPYKRKKRLRRASYLLHARIRALPGGTQMQTLSVKTDRRTQLVDVTAQVQKAVASSGVGSGICYLYVPHTTAAITINECADRMSPDVEGALDR